MEGELLGSGGLWLPWTLSPLPSEQLPLEPWRLQSFRAASQRPNSWWMPPTIRLRGGRSGSGVRVGLERAGEGGVGSNQSHLTHHPAPGHHRGSAMLVQISLPSICSHCPNSPPPGMGLCWVALRPYISSPSSSSGQHEAAPSQWLCTPHGPPVLLQTASSSHQDNRSGCRLYARGLGAAGGEVTTPGVQLLQCHWYHAPH